MPQPITSPALSALAQACQAGKLGGGDKAFATDLLKSASRGKLSEKQAAWVDKLVERASTPKAEPQKVAVADAAEMDAIVAMFATAKQNKTNPAVKLGGVRLSLYGPNSKHAGQIAVNSPGSYESRTWYGRVTLDGQFVASKAATPEVIDTLKAFAEDPAAAAAAYGKEHHECCFCATKIKTKESLAVGYGPDCAANYGLPWGAQ